MQARCRRIWIHQNRDNLLTWDDLQKQLQPLSYQIRRLGGETGYVAPRLVETGDQPDSERITDAYKDDWDGAGCGLKRLGRQGSIPGDQHVRCR